MQEGQIPLAFKVVAEKTCVSGRGESSRPSGVLLFRAIARQRIGLFGRFY